jgi:hypothetical protein
VPELMGSQQQKLPGTSGPSAIDVSVQSESVEQL